jgi:hypothetical protein
MFNVLVISHGFSCLSSRALILEGASRCPQDEIHASCCLLLHREDQLDRQASLAKSVSYRRGRRRKRGSLSHVDISSSDNSQNEITRDDGLLSFKTFKSGGESHWGATEDFPTIWQTLYASSSLRFEHCR